MTVEALYEWYRLELVRFAQSMTEDRASAEDIVQDVFCRALQHEVQLAEFAPAQARSWLRRAVKNRFIDAVRHGGFERPTDQLPERMRESEELLETEWKLILKRLPYPDGQMLWLHTVEGCTSEQLGAAFGLPAGTVRYKLHAARKQLKKELEDRYE